MFKLLAITLVAVVVMAAPSSKLNPKLPAALAAKGTVNVLVSMQDDTSSVIAMLEKATFVSRDDRVTTVANSLKNFAAMSQRDVIDVLARQKAATYEVLWISNQVWVKNADAALIQELAALADVADISEEFEVTMDQPIVGTPVENGIFAEWNVELIQSEQAWAAGYRGVGAVIGSIDTGVHGTHQDLAAAYFGTYGWRDIIGNSNAPRDDNGHGTHTVGSMLGANGLGVAPGAKWSACKGLNAAGSGTNAGLISCGQFMACPTLPNGQSPDCTKAPHVVNNSWGGGQGSTFYAAVVNSWRAAGIVPVFANGNSGPSCGSANSPGDASNVIGVGSITNTRAISSFSSRGPTIGGIIKPDISGPGSNVRSTWHTSNTAYNTISGTSMAAPHIAGVVALMKAKNPNLTPDAVRTILINNADRNIVSTGTTCGGTNDSVWPNNHFGHGIVNALRAATAA